MRKMVKYGMSLVILTLLIGTGIQANSLSVNTKSSLFFEPAEEVIDERLIVVSDTTILLRTWKTRLDDGQLIPWYSISLDAGKTVVRTVQPSYELGLRYARFDPLNGAPGVPPILSAASDIHLFIVQFFTQPLEEFNKVITNLGGNVRHYIANYGYLVEMNDNVRVSVASLPYVRWIGYYQPAYRLEEFLFGNIDNADHLYPVQRYNIQVLAVEQKTVVARRIVGLGGIVNSEDAGKFLVEATLTPDQLFTVIRWDEVLFVDRWSPYEADMNIARQIGGADYIESVAGYNGSGVQGEVFDIGFNINHVDFQSRPLIIHGSQAGSDTHGASTSGICFGDGTGNPLARGLLPSGQGIVADFNYVGMEGTSRYEHDGELLQDPYYAVFQTSSVGSSQTTQYTTVSADTDTTLFDFDSVHCQSQSNLGNQNSRPQAWAKNIISCGAVYHYDTLTKDDDAWDYGASIGPASDGRIKPDLIHFYDKILTTSGPGSTTYTSDFGGTSGATPIVAGHVGLFFQMWADGIFGNPVNPGGTVFENRAHMTTAKAMMINTADQYPFNGTSGDKIRTHQGWGMPNLQNMYDLRDNFYIIDESDLLDPFEVSTHMVSVEAGVPSLKVTMTYADPAGNPAVQSQHRINDLTLKVISPSDIVYWGNYGLTAAVWSLPDGTPDTKNTVECVYIQDPEPGAWTIQISADELIQESHVETPELDADYALVVSPVVSGPFPPQINGSSTGSIREEMSFTFVTTDPTDSPITYFIDWGDGTNSSWFGSYASGEEVAVTHTFGSEGIFCITAKARNNVDLESGWSDPFMVTIYPPELSIASISGGLFKVKAMIRNTGFGDANQVNWSMSIDGGLILGKRQITGNITTISAHSQATVASSMLMGFGKALVTFTAAVPECSSCKSRNATVFLFYIKI
jgi:serine protease AprX